MGRPTTSFSLTRMRFQESSSESSNLCIQMCTQPKSCNGKTRNLARNTRLNFTKFVNGSVVNVIRAKRRTEACIGRPPTSSSSDLNMSVDQFYCSNLCSHIGANSLLPPHSFLLGQCCFATVSICIEPVK